MANFEGILWKLRGNKEELHAFLLELVEVRLRHASGNNEHVKAIVSAMLKNTPCHLLSYLLDYFLCQLQVGDWCIAPPYQASPKVAMQWQGNDQLVTLKIRLLRHGCLGTAQFLAVTQSDAVFGFAAVGHLTETPEALASDASSSPLIAPLRVDDCLAVVVHDIETRQLEVRVCICMREFDRAKGSKRKGQGYQKRLRLMRPHSIVMVLLPSQLAKSFFPHMEQHLRDHCGQPVSFASRACADEEVRCLGGIHLVARTMSANDIIVAVSARPERLPGGLGIMSIERLLDLSILWALHRSIVTIRPTMINRMTPLIIPPVRLHQQISLALDNIQASPEPWEFSWPMRAKIADMMLHHSSALYLHLWLSIRFPSGGAKRVMCECPIEAVVFSFLFSFGTRVFSFCFFLTWKSDL